MSESMGAYDCLCKIVDQLSTRERWISVSASSGDRLINVAHIIEVFKYDEKSSTGSLHLVDGEVCHTDHSFQVLCAKVQDASVPR